MMFRSMGSRARWRAEATSEFGGPNQRCSRLDEVLIGQNGLIKFLKRNRPDRAVFVGLYEVLRDFSWNYSRSKQPIRAARRGLAR